MKEVKRLKPTIKTLRELYLKSGNQCAYPGCRESMINQEGTFIGEICHIEAASVGGKRFNQNQSNEDRRSFENLILMCPNHHKLIDDTNNQYTVDVLKNMKKQHENKFIDVVKEIANSMKDVTDDNDPRVPCTLNGMNKYFKWNHNKEELEYDILCIKKLIDKLNYLPENIRKLFYIIYKRVTILEIPGHKEYYVPLAELLNVCTENSSQEIYDFINILEKYRLCLVYEDCYERSCVYLCDIPYGNWWSEFKEYCQSNDIPDKEILINLRFDLLD